ncbi:hypothetical protein CGC46_28550 [Escherichia coli O121:H19]|nr:hypothetical protein CGC46_28550 [Escherichia coli O121:H19]
MCWSPENEIRQQTTYLRGINMSSIRLTTRMKEEIARNALIKSGVFTELEEVTKLKNEPPRVSWRVFYL